MEQTTRRNSLKYAAISLSLTTLIVACCAPAPEPETTRTPVAMPMPTPTAAPPPVVTQPVYDNWMDAPRTPGDWAYRTDGSGSLATYGNAGGNPAFAMRCDPAAGTVALLRAGSGNGAVPMRIRTETGDRMVTARQVGDQLPALRTDLPARDALLEAMAFSKGRFAVEAQGLPTLYVPAWPEVTRVIEDCR